MQGVRLLELGSGTGVVGLSAALLGAQVRACRPFGPERYMYTRVHCPPLYHACLWTLLAVAIQLIGRVARAPLTLSHTMRIVSLAIRACSADV